MEYDEEMRARQIRQRVSDYPAPVYIDGKPSCAECGNTLPKVRADRGWGQCVECRERHEAQNQ